MFPEIVCKWKEFEDYWETDCGEAFSTFEGSLEDNKIVFCPFCGKKITEVKIERE